LNSRIVRFNTPDHDDLSRSVGVSGSRPWGPEADVESPRSAESGPTAAAPLRSRRDDRRSDCDGLGGDGGGGGVCEGGGLSSGSSPAVRSSLGYQVMHVHGGQQPPWGGAQDVGILRRRVLASSWTRPSRLRPAPASPPSWPRPSPRPALLWPGPSSSPSWPYPSPSRSNRRPLPDLADRGLGPALYLLDGVGGRVVE